MRFKPFAAALLASMAFASPAPAQERLADLLSDPKIRLARPADRAEVVARLRNFEEKRRQNARARAFLRGLPLRRELPNGRIQEIFDFEDDRPLYLTTDNTNAAISTGANLLQAAPYSLTGAGITIGLWDGGPARATHQEFGSRLTVMDGTTNVIDHASHVGGTLVASGINGAARGMAPGATVNSYDWNNDTSEMTSRGAATAGDPGKIYLSNHSYNFVNGWNYVNGGSPYRLWEWYSSGTSSTSIETDFGLYNSTARDSDSLAFNAPYYLIFRSAGNDNNDNPANGDSVALSPGGGTVVTYNSASHPAGDGNYRGGFETIGFNAVAKNVITVGSTLDAVSNGTRHPANANLNSFSACGPTDDGRIKPDIVANGDSLYSSSGGSDTAYATLSGTSMATPNAAGSAALLIEQYSLLFPAQAMRASTLKGLLIHTASDRGNAGPDYRYGWGLVNVQAAADLIRDHYNIPAKQRITENQLTNSVKTRTHSFAWDGVSPIRATLAWTDPAGATSTSDSRTPNLVNNLNLKIVAPNGSESFPYVMPFVGTWTTASMSTPATTGINNTDNIEQVQVISPPVVGTYQAVVTCPGTLTNGVQNYSLLISGSFAEPPFPPSPPSNFSAAPGNNTVSLTWNASSTATRYTIKRAQTSGGPYNILGNPTTTTYTDSTALNGTSYFYVVSASNSAGEGSNSGEINAIPAATPSSTILTVSPSSSSSYGSPVTLTATVSSGATSGTVTFRNDMGILGTGIVNNSSQAVYTTILPLGNRSLTAEYTGNSIFGPSTSPALAHTVTPRAVTINGVVAGNKIYDANTSANLSGGTVSGVISGETVTITPGTGVFSNSDSGLRSVVASGYSLDGPHVGNYLLSAQPIVPDATIMPLPLQLSGTRSYDGTDRATNILTPQNTLIGANLTVTGEMKLTDRNTGLKNFSVLTAASRIQSTTGTTGSASASSFNVALSSPPGTGNTLIAVISTRGNSAGRISAITQTGASWSRASQATNTSGTTTEIWFTSSLTDAGSTITISQASLRSTAVVMEYRGVLVANPLDRSSSSTGSNTSTVTGTTPLTSQANELWIGGIGIADGRRTLNAPYGNSFNVVASPKSGTSSSDSMVYAFEKIVDTAATAGTSGTLSSSDSWAGTIATFRAVTPDNLNLAGPAAGNYTLTGATGSVLITPFPITLTAVSATKTFDRTTFAAGTPAIDPPLIAGDSATILTQAFLDANAGVGNKAIIPSITINDGNGGANYEVTAVNNNTGTIFPATASIELTNLSQTFDGAPKPVTVTVPPEVSSVVIAYDGSSTAPINEGTYVVTATIADPNYQGGTTSLLTITPGNDFTSWKNRNFTEADQLAGLAADTADPDADTRPNLAEYALGSDPKSFNPALMALRDENGLSIIFTRPEGLPNVTYSAESSEDLETWSPVLLEVLSSGPMETLRARDPLAEGDPAHRFLRLRFGRP
jgi:hypothetical protein